MQTLAFIVGYVPNIVYFWISTTWIYSSFKKHQNWHTIVSFVGNVKRYVQNILTEEPLLYKIVKKLWQNEAVNFQIIPTMD